MYIHARNEDVTNKNKTKAAQPPQTPPNVQPGELPFCVGWLLPSLSSPGRWWISSPIVSGMYTENLANLACHFEFTIIL